MKKINNKVLAVGLAVLVGIFLIARLVRAPKLEGNTHRQLVSLDLEKISEVRISSGDSSLSLLKENDKWNVVKGQTKFEADSAAVMRTLQNIQHLEAMSMASRKKEKWSDFKVDSTSTRVTVFYGGDKEADFHVGKFSFDQSSQQNIKAYTYLRLEDEDEVYIVDGFLGAMVPVTTSSWKKKPVLPDSTGVTN